MKSHEFAEEMKRTADYLLSREDVEFCGQPFIFACFGTEKEKFLAAVRATIPGKKEISDWDVSFKPTGTMLTMTIQRSAVCRKIQDVKWECLPLLSQEEDSQMEAQP